MFGAPDQPGPHPPIRRARYPAPLAPAPRGLYIVVTDNGDYRGRHLPKRSASPPRPPKPQRIEWQGPSFLEMVRKPAGSTNPHIDPLRKLLSRPVLRRGVKAGVSGSIGPVHLYSTPPHIVAASSLRSAATRPWGASRAGIMRDSVSELRRTHLPRTPVNKGKKEGPGLITPRLLLPAQQISYRPASAAHTARPSARRRASKAPRDPAFGVSCVFIDTTTERRPSGLAAMNWV